MPSDWRDKPAKLRQTDRDARWSQAKARLREDGTRHADIAIPVFGYKSPAGIDRRHGLIRTWEVADASSHDGRMLRRGLSARAVQRKANPRPIIRISDPRLGKRLRLAPLAPVSGCAAGPAAASQRT